jgi:hypothetical protein
MALTFEQYLKQFDTDSEISSNTDVHNPSRYERVSDAGRPFLLYLRLTPEELEMKCINFIEANKLNFSEACLVKYLWRLGEKDSIEKCLSKARWYAIRQTFNQINPSFMTRLLWSIGIGKPAFDLKDLFDLIAEISYSLDSRKF